MDRDYRGHLPDEAVDKLTRDRLPPDLETAEAEYFADMAFDERLSLLLANQPPMTIIDMEHTTSGTLEGFASELFSPNTTEVVEIPLSDGSTQELYMPAFAYTMRGFVQKLPDHLEIDAVITPLENLDGAIRIQNNRENTDSFFVSDSTNETFAIDSMALMRLLCQLGGADMRSINALCTSLKKVGLNKPSVFQNNIEEIWGRLGEGHGEKTVVAELRHLVQQPARSDFPEYIKLRHEEVEKTGSTVTRLYLEHATEMSDLDVESSYCLKLEFEQKAEYVTDKNAERVTVTGIETPRLISLDFGRKLKGRITPLNLDTIEVKELFVDWFDQIVSE